MFSWKKIKNEIQSLECKHTLDEQEEKKIVSLDQGGWRRWRKRTVKDFSSHSHMICVDLMVQNNENKRIISKNDGTFKLSSKFTNLILIFAGGGILQLFNQQNCRRQSSLRYSQEVNFLPQHKMLLAS